MNYVILLSTLLTTVRSLPNHEVNLINQLNDFFCFDHNIFLLDRSVQDHNRHVPINAKIDGRITPQTVYIFDYEDDLNATTDTQREQLKNLTTEVGQNTFLIVVVGGAGLSSNFTNGTQILDDVITIQRVKAKVKIGIFIEQSISSMEMVLQLFRWSWSKRIVNIFCAFYLNVKDGDVSSALTVFRFDPFDVNFSINLTGSNSFQDYFNSDAKIVNYRHHPLQLIMLPSKPLDDYTINFWSTVTDVFNASISFLNASTEAFMKEAFSAVNGEAGMFRVVITIKMEGLMLHPSKFSYFYLVVPHAPPCEDFFAYLENTTWVVVFGCICVVIVTAALLLVFSGYLHARKRNSFVQCVVDVVNLLINDNLAIKYGQLHHADICIVVPLTFIGLIVANGILSVFKSYLTVPIYQRQMKTIDEVYKARMRILSDEENAWANATIRQLKLLTGKRDWNEIVQPVTFARHDADLKQLNNSVAYSATSAKVDLCFSLQKRLNLKAFYLIADQSLNYEFETFPVNPDYQFFEPLNMIYQRLISNGMLDKWQTDSRDKILSEMTKAKRLSLHFKSNRNDSNKIGFGGMFTTIWCGWIAGGIAFISELIWYKIQPQIIRRSLNGHQIEADTLSVLTANGEDGDLLLTS